MSDIPRIIEVDDIWNGNIAFVLEAVGLPARTYGDEEVWVEHDDEAMSLKLIVNERDKMIVFQSSIGLNELSPIADKYKLSDELNRAILIRFYVHSPGCLVGDYYLSYEHGLLTNQLILTCQLFRHIFVNILREKYEDNGVLDLS